MPRPKREKPDPHIVFVDTSTLFFENKGPPVDPTFNEFWTDYCVEFDLELRVPEVVRGELLYQHSTKALDSLEKANEHIAKVGHVTNKSYSHRVDNSRVKKEIESKLDDWLKSVSAEVIITPTNTIQWNNIIEMLLSV